MHRQKIDGLDVYGKLEIYFHYYAVQMSIKHSFQIVDKTTEKQSSHNGQMIPWKHGRGEPDKEFGTISGRTANPYLSKNFRKNVYMNGFGSSKKILPIYKFFIFGFVF